MNKILNDSWKMHANPKLIQMLQNKAQIQTLPHGAFEFLRHLLVRITQPANGSVFIQPSDPGPHRYHSVIDYSTR